MNSLRLSLITLAYLLAFSVNLSYAQEYQPSGRHYANTITLISADSEEGALAMGLGVVADVTGDGLDEVIFSGEEPGHNSDPEAKSPLFIMTRSDDGLMINGAATIINGPVPVLPGPGARNVLSADFNGDGQMDIFLDVQGAEPDCGNECFPGGPNWLLLSDDDGKLNNVTDTNLPTFSDFSHGSSVADFDGDGDLDIWVNNSGGGPVRYPNWSYLLHNDGLGKFTVVADLYVLCCDTPIVGRNGILPDGDYGNSLWSVPIDADGDGDMDLHFNRATDWTNFREGGELDYYNRLLVNDGEGHFEIFPGDSYPSIGCRLSPHQPDPELCRHDDLPFTQYALVYDLNHDGLDDMLLHQTLWWGENDEFEGSAIQILISNGDGTFRDESSERYPGELVFGLTEFQLHDLDGDGHKDLFSYANFEKYDIRINDGEGYFRRLADDWVHTDWHWRVLDVDGDGGTDFLVQGWQGYTLSKMNLPYGAVLDGTEENDRLIGGAHDNVYRGLAGDDVLDGGLGNDQLDGGPGDDNLVGGKGNDTFDLRSSDLSGHDQVFDKQGKDKLVFLDFGFEKVTSARQSETGSLILNFIDGGSLEVEKHFVESSYGVERIEVDDCSYRISMNPGFETGSIQDILGGCIIFDGGFESF